jgi:hypothetical protein
VARELENPFHNVPNEVPLNNFHAQYNHALLTMFCGYHPDAYWQCLRKDSIVDDIDNDADHYPGQNPSDHRPSIVVPSDEEDDEEDDNDTNSKDGAAMSTTASTVSAGPMTAPSSDASWSDNNLRGAPPPIMSAMSSPTISRKKLSAL